MQVAAACFHRVYKNLSRSGKATITARRALPDLKTANPGLLRQHYRHWLIVGLDRQADRLTLIEDLEPHRKTHEYRPFDLFARLQFGLRSERRLSAGFQRGKSLVVAFEIHRRKGVAAQFAVRRFQLALNASHPDGLVAFTADRKSEGDQSGILAGNLHCSNVVQ